MKIATNLPFAFPHTPDVKIVHLGDDTDDTSLIVLMLSKNWGAASIGKIKSLTRLVANYPSNIPCYIVGAESTMPDNDIYRYRHKERDEAIRLLCDEVLLRSKSIGVRGEITYRHLTEIIGYPNEKVDLIYRQGDDKNLESIVYFLNKNNVYLNRFRYTFLMFNNEEYAVDNNRIYNRLYRGYERTLSFEKNIVIGEPYISHDDSYSRLNSDVRIDGEVKTIWCETDRKYSDYFLDGRVDAFLCVLLPFAMRSGRDIVCEAPVTDHLLHNIKEILVPQLCTYDYRLHRSEIIARGEGSQLSAGNAVATGMSCGVDSFYTANLYTGSPFQSMNLTHLYCGNYLYGNESSVYQRAQAAADAFGLPLIRTSTNINEEIQMHHLHTHFFKTMFGVLALRRLFRTYYYSTAKDFGHSQLVGNATRDTSDYELLLLYCFSAPDLQIITGGVKSERVDKTRGIASLDAAQKLLNVCLYPSRQAENCGKCEKCKRTLLTLDMLGALERFSAVFPLEEYRNTKIDSLTYLIQQKDSPYFEGVYDYFCRTEPNLMKQAQSLYDNKTKN